MKTSYFSRLFNDFPNPGVIIMKNCNVITNSLL